MTNGFAKSVPNGGSYEGDDAAWPAELRVFQAEGRIEIDFGSENELIRVYELLTER